MNAEICFGFSCCWIATTLLCVKYDLGHIIRDLWPVWMFKKGGGGVSTTSNPSFLILPNWRDLKGEQSK